MGFGINRLKTFVKKFILRNESNAFLRGKVFYSNSVIDELTPEQIEIGENFISAPGSIILSHDASLSLLYGCYRIEKTIIGKNVFLGANAIILPGVKIGNQVIIGAGSIVTKNIPDGVVVAGNPARIICSVEDYHNKCKEKNVLYKINNDIYSQLLNGNEMDKAFFKALKKSLNNGFSIQNKKQQ